MNCGKCGALNQDGAEFCTFCYESFKIKAAIKAPTIIFPNVTTEFGFWETLGPLLITREAIIFLVEKCEDVSERKSVKGNIKHNLMHQGLAGMALGFVFNDALTEKMPLKPVEVHLKAVHWDQPPLRDYPEVQLQAKGCDEYFILEKKDLVKIKVGFLGSFSLFTKTAEIKTMAMEEREMISGFLRSSGYPLE